MFKKSYITAFEQVGKRRHLTGCIGELHDEGGLLIHSQLYDDKPQAEAALDALVHELLTDAWKHGLVDALPELAA